MSELMEHYYSIGDRVQIGEFSGWGEVTECLSPLEDGIPRYVVRFHRQELTNIKIQINCVVLETQITFDQFLEHLLNLIDERLKFQLSHDTNTPQLLVDGLIANIDYYRSLILQNPRNLDLIELWYTEINYRYLEYYWKRAIFGIL
jgi:hypothetical protein